MGESTLTEPNGLETQGIANGYFLSDAVTHDKGLGEGNLRGKQGRKVLAGLFIAHDNIYEILGNAQVSDELPAALPGPAHEKKGKAHCLEGLQDKLNIREESASIWVIDCSVEIENNDFLHIYGGYKQKQLSVYSGKLGRSGFSTLYLPLSHSQRRLSGGKLWNQK